MSRWFLRPLFGLEISYRPLNIDILVPLNEEPLKCLLCREFHFTILRNQFERTKSFQLSKGILLQTTVSFNELPNSDRSYLRYK